MRAFAVYIFGPAEAKRMRGMLNEAEENLYQFAHIFCLFHLNVARSLGSGRRFAFGQYFDVRKAVDQTDKTLSCS